MSTPAIFFLPGWGMQTQVFAPLIDALGCEAHFPPSPDAVPAHALVCGWSLGAMRALHHAVSRRPRALMLIAATPRFVQTPDWPHGVAAAAFAQFQAGIEADCARTLKHFAALQATGHTQPGMARRLAALTAAPEPVPLRPGLAQLHTLDLRATAHTVDCPTLLIHGRADAVTPLSAGAWLASALPAAQLHTQDNCGHAPHLAAPTQVAGLMHDFLRALP